MGNASKYCLVITAGPAQLVVIDWLIRPLLIIVIGVADCDQGKGCKEEDSILALLIVRILVVQAGTRTAAVLLIVHGKASESHTR